jgi:hypothetical protein
MVDDFAARCLRAMRAVATEESLTMSTLSRHHTGGYRVRFFIFLATGERYRRDAYRRDKRAAGDLAGLANRLEALTRQQALTPDLAVTFQHEGLLRDEDVARLFPEHQALTFDRAVLLTSYEELCRRQCTSTQVIAINLSRAQRLLDALSDLSRLTARGIEAWQNRRLTQVARKTVNLEHDIVRQLLDLCVQHRWRTDNPRPWCKKIALEALSFAASPDLRSGPGSAPPGR